MRSTDRRMTIEPVILAPIGRADVRVRVEIAGVCHSDLSLARGLLDQPTPAVLGHEACGVVLETGPDVTTVQVGDRVLLLWQAPCGDCRPCRRGEPYLCVAAARRARGHYGVDSSGSPVYQGLSVGAFAEQSVLPATAVVPIPDDLADRDAVLLGCAATTGIGAVLNTAAVSARDSVCVLGLGAVGLSAVQGARLAGARTIVAVDRNEAKLALATAVGATHTLVADDDLVRGVREITDGEGVDHAFDCVGSAQVIRAAWSVSRRGGSVTVVGIGGRDDKVEFSALELFHFGRTLRGCVAGGIDPARDLPRFFGWVRSGDLDLAALRSREGGLADVEEAFDRMSQGKDARTLITPGSDR